MVTFHTIKEWLTVMKTALYTTQRIHNYITYNPYPNKTPYIVLLVPYSILKAQQSFDS